MCKTTMPDRAPAAARTLLVPLAVVAVTVTSAGCVTSDRRVVGPASGGSSSCVVESSTDVGTSTASERWDRTRELLPIDAPLHDAAFTGDLDGASAALD